MRRSNVTKRNCFNLAIEIFGLASNWGIPTFAPLTQVSISQSRFLVWPLTQRLETPNSKTVSISQSRFLVWPPICVCAKCHYAILFQSRNRDFWFGLLQSVGRHRNQSRCFNLAIEIFGLASQASAIAGIYINGFQSRNRDFWFGLPNEMPASVVAKKRFNLAIEIFGLASN